MSNYTPRHRRPRLAWRQIRASRTTTAPPRLSLDVAPAAVSLFAPTAKTGSA